MHIRKAVAVSTTVLLSLVAAAQTPALNGPSFVPDLRSASLADWHIVGNATWHEENGELVGKGGATGGWLVLNHSYQDTAVYAAFRCAGPCDTGVLLRMTPTVHAQSGAQSGAYFGVSNQTVQAENLTLSPDGALVARETLRPAGGMVRFAPPEADPTALPANGWPPPPEPGPGITLPVTRPHPGVRDDAWNEFEILLDANILRARINGMGPGVSVATANDDLNGYGPIALYVGKNSEVRFKDVAYKDLALRTQPLQKVGERFRRQQLTPFYYNWTAVASDFNHDGHLDLISGAYLYFGPDFTQSREIYPARTFNPSNEYSTWDQHSYDFTGDGWDDVVATYLGVGAVLYVNPAGESRRWKQYRVLPGMQSEYTIVKDVDGDGKPELVYVADGFVRYAKPDPADPTRPWLAHTVSGKGPWSAHGVGVGDLNGDGRADIVNAYGWWEGPPPGSGDGPWKYHPQAFGRWGPVSFGGSEMGIYDVNGDGLNDVVTSLDAHGFGLAWFEQKRNSNGDITFIEHMVMDNYNTRNAGGVTFAEIHGTTAADVDGDGIPDFIAGKRQFSHQDDLLDPDAYSPPYLYWYKTVRDKSAPGGARLVPELIDNATGAGDNLLAVDLNGDGAMDIVTATKRGLYIYWGKPAAAVR